MAKRSHGEGSLYQLPNGKWRGLVTVDGRRLSHTSRTRAEVVNWIRKITDQVKAGMTYEASRVTLGSYLVAWLASIEHSIRPVTYSHYKSLVEKYLIPDLGEILVKDLTADRVQFTYDAWNQKGVGAHTIAKAHAVLHHALQRAEKTGLTIKNVCDLANPPIPPHKEMRFWSESEANRFLVAAKENRMYALFYLSLVTGARQMELLGLQWGDLDWSRGTLHFCRQLARMGEMFAQQKTKAAKRTLTLGAGTLTILKEHKIHQDLERRLAGEAWQEHDLIFTTLSGTPMRPTNLIDRYFNPLVEAAGVPRIRFHDLRHTAVSIMLNHNVSIFAVSKIVGHARPSITSDIYGHLLPGAIDDIGQMMDELIGPMTVQLKELKKEP